jgi:ferredoxin-like protein FixX
MTEAEFSVFLIKNNLRILEKLDDNYVLVQTKYGICKVKGYHLKSGVVPTIQSAINKEEYFKNIAEEKHGKFYDYSKVVYKNTITPVEIQCPIHGQFWILPCNHINKKRQGCGKCTREKPNKKLIGIKNFKKRANHKHNTFYDYSLITSYTGQYEKVVIICPIHGEFTQTVKGHLKGAGCLECAKIKISKSRRKDPTGWEHSRWVKASKKSKDFDSYKVYIIECYDEKECFIKIGRTYKKVQNRFRTYSMLPYNYVILEEFVGEALDICNLEIKLKSLCKEFKYIPAKNFNGMYECYTKNCLETITLILK